jgi:hypothetical protein
MLVPFNTMPDEARLWVYQANRLLTEAEQQHVLREAADFLMGWKAHGVELQTACTLEHGHFLVIAVDEAHHGASGCSIDASVGFVRTLENQLGVQFLDRTKVAILLGDHLELIPLAELKSRVQQGDITSDTLVFNNSLSTLGEWRNHWKTPAGESWMKRYFEAVV